MRENNLLKIFVIIGLLPSIYYLFILPQLPNQVPVHFTKDLSPDKFESKLVFLLILLGVFAIGYLVIFVLNNISKISTETQEHFGQSGEIKIISWIIFIFVFLISWYFIYRVQSYVNMTSSNYSPKLPLALIVFFVISILVVLKNIKPNYYIGFRTPWSLSDSDNWKKTHRFSFILCILGGTFILIMLLLLPSKYSFLITFLGVLLIVILPFVYSYKLHKKSKKESCNSTKPKNKL